VTGTHLNGGLSVGDKGAMRRACRVAAVSALPPAPAASNGYVVLGDVADVEIVPAPNEIQHENGSRRIDVTCNVQGREIEERVKAMPFARGYHPEFIGEYAASQESQRSLFLLGAMSLVGILMLL
jgi:Cu/Ag efflux pump CusA